MRKVAQVFERIFKFRIRCQVNYNFILENVGVLKEFVSAYSYYVGLGIVIAILVIVLIELNSPLIGLLKEKKR